MPKTPLSLIGPILMFLIMIRIVRTMRIKRCMPLSLFGHQRPNPVQFRLSSRFKKNRQEELKFTFDVSKCDRIFDELLKNGNIRLSQAIPSLDELKRHAYCKCHNSTSHATNDCNVFRRQVQSAINEGRLVLSEMQIDKAPFPLHTLELNNPKILTRPDQTEGAKGKNTVIGDPKPMNANDKILAGEVIKEKTDEGKDTLKITIRNPRLGGQGSYPPENRSAAQA